MQNLRRSHLVSWERSAEHIRVQTIIFGENAFKSNGFFSFSFRNEIISTTGRLCPPGFALLCLPALGEMLNTPEQADSLFPASPGLMNTVVLCISWRHSTPISPGREESFTPSATISHGLCSQQSPQGCWHCIDLPSTPLQTGILLWHYFI